MWPIFDKLRLPISSNLKQLPTCCATNFTHLCLRPQILWLQLISLITNYAEHFIIEKRVVWVVNLRCLNVNHFMIIGFCLDLENISLNSELLNNSVCSKVGRSVTLIIPIWYRNAFRKAYEMKKKPYLWLNIHTKIF